MAISKKAVLWAGLLASALVIPQTSLAAKVKLEVWVNTWQPAKALQDIIKGFESANHNVIVNVTSPGIQTQLFPKLLVQSAAGVPPDVVVLFPPISSLSDKGLLTPLNAYMKTSKLCNTKNYNTGQLDSFTTNGKVYAIPSLESGPQLALVYNKNLFKEAGLDPDSPPNTLDEIKTYHKKLTKIENNVIKKWGFSAGASMGGFYFPETYGAMFGAKLVENRRVVFDSPELAKAVDFVASFREGVQTNSYNAWRSKAGDWAQSVAGGFEAMEINGYWTPGYVDPKGKADTRGYTWVPNAKGDKMQMLGGWSFGIPMGSKKKDLAFKLIEYMATPEPCQKIFNQFGFLPGNLQTLKHLDLSRHPEVKWYLDSLTSADRLLAIPDVPEWGTCRDPLLIGVEKVCNRQIDARTMLKQVQKDVDVIMDKYYGKLKNYHK